LAGSPKGKLIPIDGKPLRHSFDRAHGKASIHMVSAWASANGLCVGQLATAAKSNKIKAIPKLLGWPDARGAAVLIDAKSCQKAIAAGGKDFPVHAHREVDGDHGRVEIRRAWVTPDVDWCEDREPWKALRSFAVVECERHVGDKITCERRYFISSLPGTDAQAITTAVRIRWQIENKQHWLLDVSFHEDQSRIRKGHAAENFSRVRRMAFHLLKQETTVCKLGVNNKRLRAGWDNDYLLHVLQI
jgi:predicted transposase YbfD/YdcC